MESCRGICNEQGWRKGPWSPVEDKLLIEYVSHNGEGRWSSVSKCTGLNRSGKSCRLRWVNYLRPGLKKGHLTPQEEGIIIELHALWGNKWSTIARYLPGRTDNEIKNYWRTHFKKSTRKPINYEIKQQKKRIFRQKQEQIDNMKIISKIPQTAQLATSGDEIKNIKQDQAEITFSCIDDEHQILPMIYDDQDNKSWPSDYVEDCYLWGGLWDMYDNNPIGKMEAQNLGNYFCEEYAVDFGQREGYIF